LIATDLGVRKLARGDELGEVEDLLVRFFREEGFTTPADVIASHLHAMLSVDACAVFAAYSGTEAVGVATISLNFGIEFGWFGEMGDLYVVPACRGRGVSLALIAAVEAFLKERGASGYQVTVTPYAEEHHRLTEYYASRGFLDEGRRILSRRLPE
jgi:GNAT superfamily N-acetyltransferase